VLDTRDPTEFAAAHLTGSINVGLGGPFATWVGTVLTRDHPIVIVADPGHEHEAAVRLGRIGFDQILGYLDQGLLSLQERPDLLTSTERISPPIARERAAQHAAQMVDVRAPHERQEKRIEGSIALPLSQLPARLDELDRRRPVVVHCAGGYRSSIAASLLEARGFTHVSELAGGFTAWESAGLPTVP
jgi:rhodanese-related sulfurtransferase